MAIYILYHTYLYKYIYLYTVYIYIYVCIRLHIIYHMSLVVDHIKIWCWISRCHGWKGAPCRVSSILSEICCVENENPWSAINIYPQINTTLQPHSVLVNQLMLDTTIWTQGPCARYGLSTSGNTCWTTGHPRASITESIPICATCQSDPRPTTT